MNKIVTPDGWNFFATGQLIKAVTPNTEGSGDPTLVVSMIDGESVVLRGTNAEAMREILLSVAMTPPSGLAIAGELSRPGHHEVEGHKVPLGPRPTNETISSGSGEG